MTMTPGEAIETAVRQFIADTEGSAALCAGAVLVFEVVQLDDDGDAIRKISYAIGTDGTPHSSAIGLCRAGERLIARDLNLYVADDDDDEQP